MRLVKATDYKDASKKAADILAAQILLKPKSTIGLATGATPIGTYEELVRRHSEEGLSFSEVTTINLDEYIGLKASDPQSYFHFMKEHLHGLVDIKPENVHLPNGSAENIDQECRHYDNVIMEAGGVDLQLLGIGTNGHVGFNEPGDTITNDTYNVALTENTIADNKRFFEKQEDVPRRAITMGVGTIMRARKILMIITGANKAEILKEALFGPITPRVPASLIRLHSDVVVVADSEALALVKDLV